MIHSSEFSPNNSSEEKEAPSVIVPEERNLRTESQVEDYKKTREDAERYIKEQEEKKDREKELLSREQKGEKLTVEEQEFLHEMYKEREERKKKAEGEESRETMGAEEDKKPEVETGEEREAKELFKMAEELEKELEKEAKRRGTEVPIDPVEAPEDPINFEEEPEIDDRTSDLISRIESFGLLLINREGIKNLALEERKKRIEEAERRGKKAWRAREGETIEDVRKRFIEEKTNKAIEEKRKRDLMDYFVNLGKKDEYEQALSEGKLEEIYKQKLDELAEKIKKNRGVDITSEQIQSLLDAKVVSGETFTMGKVEELANEKRGVLKRMFGKETYFTKENLDNAEAELSRQEERLKGIQVGRWNNMMRSAKEDIKRRMQRRAIDIAKSSVTERAMETDEERRSPEETEEGEGKEKMAKLEKKYEAEFESCTSYGELCDKIEDLYRESGNILSSKIGYDDAASLNGKMADVFLAYDLREEQKADLRLRSVPNWAKLRENLKRILNEKEK